MSKAKLSAASEQELISPTPIVLVTGSTGLIGSRVVKASLASGYRVIGLDVKPPREDSPGAGAIPCSRRGVAPVGNVG
jgi:nucleoside-diphosphate-sugar epimerase